jgi:pyridoxine 4-dehydrogenase
MSLSSRLRCTGGVGKRGQDWGHGTQRGNSDTIKEAAKITKIVAVEVELSLWPINSFTNYIVKACPELNIPICAKVDLELKAFSR